MVSFGAASATDPIGIEVGGVSTGCESGGASFGPQRFDIRQAKRFKGASEHQDSTPLTEQQAVRQPTEDGIAGVVAPTDDAVTDRALNDVVTDAVTGAARTAEMWKAYEKHLDEVFERIFFKRMREYNNKEPDWTDED